MAAYSWTLVFLGFFVGICTEKSRALLVRERERRNRDEVWRAPINARVRAPHLQQQAKRGMRGA